MQSWLWLLAFVGVSVGAAGGARATETELDEEKLVIVEKITGVGQALATSKAGDEWKLEVGDVLEVGDKVEVEEGTVLDLKLADGSMLRLAPQSHFVVSAIERPRAGWLEWTFRLISGAVSGLIRDNEAQSSDVKLRILSTRAQMGVRGTEFTFGIDQESDEAVLETHTGEVVFGGADADLKGGEGVERVRGGQITSFPKGASRPLPVLAAAAGKRERYARLSGFFARAESLRSRPMALQPRIRDLDKGQRQELRRDLRERLQNRLDRGGGAGRLRDRKHEGMRGRFDKGGPGGARPDDAFGQMKRSLGVKAPGQGRMQGQRMQEQRMQGQQSIQGQHMRGQQRIQGQRMQGDRRHMQQNRMQNREMRNQRMQNPGAQNSGMQNRQGMQNRMNQQRMQQTQQRPQMQQQPQRPQAVQPQAQRPQPQQARPTPQQPKR